MFMTILFKSELKREELLEYIHIDCAECYTTVEVWFVKFQRRKLSTEDNAPNGYLKLPTEENIKKDRKMILHTRKMKLKQISRKLCSFHFKYELYEWIAHGESTPKPATKQQTIGMLPVCPATFLTNSTSLVKVSYGVFFSTKKCLLYLKICNFMFVS